jgi:PAS domain S-box-containing protein
MRTSTSFVGRRFRDLPIKNKLTAIGTLTAAAAVLLACAAFVTYEQVTFRRTMTRDLSITAQMIGFNSAAALSFNDTGSAEQTLRALTAHPHIMAACIYDAQGQAFAAYRRGEYIGLSDWPKPAGNSERFGSHSLELFREINLAGETIGTIYLESDLAQITARWQRYAGIMGVVMALALLVAWRIAFRLQRLISQPISELANVMASVSSSVNDYSVRAVRYSNDELGRLVDGFNHMLAQIQARDADLHQAHAELEKRVEERTEALLRAQQHAARDQARFKFIFDSVPVGISWHVPNEEHTHLVNPAHERITGVSARDALRPGAFERVSHPDDLRRQKELTAKFVTGEVDHYSIEKRYLHPDGRIVWAVMTSRMFTDPANGKRQSVTTLVDVSDLKKVQEQIVREQARFKFIFESLPIGVSWVVCTDRSTRIANAAYARICGVPIEQCNDEEAYRSTTFVEDQRRHDELEARLLAGKIDQFSIERRFRHSNCTQRWAEHRVRVLRDPNSGETQLIGTLVDITERKQSEVELERVHKRVLETSRQAGMAEVATGVLHNVGNVLNSVNVSAVLVENSVRGTTLGHLKRVCELLRQRHADLGTFLTTDPKGRQVVTFIETVAAQLDTEQAQVRKEIESLRKNIDHIKEIVAMQQSYAKVSGVLERVAASELVEDAVRINASALDRHGVTLIRDYQAQPMMTVDKHKVLQILVNFIRNAKYACDESGRPDKQVTVRITADADMIRLSVADNGIGIPTENLTRIFNHGFTTRTDGHGFGLHSGAIAAKEMGGAVTVASDGPWQGATFTLEIPAQEEDKAA